jgi:ADP-ribosylglycohydrolase
MLGAIIGDIIGSRWEFNPTNDYYFELFSSHNDFTDDTICTIAVADALLHDSDDYGAYIHKWCRRYPHPMGGYGGNFAKWVANNNPQPYGSYGNGSAMRVSPIGMWFDDEERVLTEAEKVAACTHNHPEGIKGAQAIALGVFWAVKSFDGLITQEQMDQEIVDIVSSLLIDYDYKDLNYEDYRNKFDETCQGTVPVALDIICKSDSFEDAIRRAVSLGADADTLGAIVGSIAEHIWGIPDYMIDAAMSHLPSEMQHIVSEFYEKCHHRATYKPRRAEKEISQKEAFMAMMHWKLGYGNFNKIIKGECSHPHQEKVATSSDWETKLMPESAEYISTIKLAIPITYEEMAILQYGHIPQEQEDHWFMYCDGEYIRYYRSWSGQWAFVAHYHKEEDCYFIDELTINHALAEFGVNGNEAGVWLFRYLITAETGGDEVGAWQDYINAWDKLDRLYNKS